MTYEPPSPDQPAPWPRFTAPAPHEVSPRPGGAASDGQGASWARWGSLPPRETPRVAYAPAPAPQAEVTPTAPPVPPPPTDPPSEPSRALVPVALGREVTLGDLGRAARRAAPAMAVAGLAAVAASMLFRRR